MHELSSGHGRKCVGCGLVSAAAVLATISPLLPLHCDNNSPRAAIVAVLVQVDALPGAQRQASLGDGDSEANAHQ